jgi:enoyl-CoA hydratase/carnithine racemase
MLTFNRPDKLNALSWTMLEQLEAALDRLAEDVSVRVVVLTGGGGRAFVAGADIAEYSNDPAAFIAYQKRGRAVFEKIEALPKVTIAAIGGYALGGGFEIALCCDILVCSESARLGLPEGTLGLCPGGGGSQRLTRTAGKATASDVMLCGRRLSGADAYRLGLAAEVVPDAELRDAALKRARWAMKIAPLAAMEMKRLIREGADAALPAAASLEQEVLFRLFRTADGQEGIAAFLERRSPHFVGK